MRISRYLHEEQTQFGFYYDQYLINVETAARAYTAATGQAADLSGTDSMLETPVVNESL